MKVACRLLGGAQVRQGGEWLELPRDMRGGLLAYLALEQGAVSRERLAFLFWPDVPEGIARQNFRQLLRRTKWLPYVTALAVTECSVAWPVSCDALAFRAAVDAGDHPTALTLYRGELLAGFELDAEEFGAWMAFEREVLASTYLATVLAHASALSSQGALREAIRVVEPLIWRDDEMAEVALQAYLRFALAAGEAEYALWDYRRWADRLRREFGAEPLPATVKLAKSLEQPHVAPKESLWERDALPRFTTPFIGRDPELTELLNLLGDPDCCLLTVVGPGGIGKTRLAVEAARLASGGFGDGSLFLPLEAITDSRLVPSALAAALELPLRAGASAEETVISFLRQKEMLLVWDNLEHLLPETGFLARLLSHCSRLKVLATSRERVGVSGEWLFELGGLNLPSSPEAEALERFDAIQLFVRAARRARADFALQDGNRREILAICRRVEGSPLALELAASWLRILSSQEIAEALQGDLDLLAQELSDLPERQRSLRRVFEHSWRLLSTEEQLALARLTVFRGGFAREAAETALGIATRTLLRLYDKSLVKRQARGRFSLHELVRQYAAERLVDDDEAFEQHARFYCSLLATLEPFNQGARQAQAVETLNSELDNVRAAWWWASERCRLDVLAPAIDSLWQFYEIRSLYAEGEEAFRLAAEKCTPGEDSAARAMLLAHLGALLHRTGKLKQCEEVSRKSLAMSERLGLPPVWTAAYNLAVVPLIEGELTKAQQQHEHTLALGRKHRDDLLVGSALNGLGLLAVMRGEVAEAEQYYLQSLDSWQDQANTWSLTIAHSNLGVLYLKQHKHAEASRYLRQALELATALGQRAMAQIAHFNLGRLALVQGDPRAAQTHLETSLHLAQTIGHRDGIEATLILLARVQQAHQSLSQAHASLQLALESALERRAVARALDAVVASGELYAEAGDAELALELLVYARAQPELRHPADPDLELNSGQVAEELYQRLATALGPHAVKEAHTRAAGLDHDALWRRLERAPGIVD